MKRFAVLLKIIEKTSDRFQSDLNLALLPKNLIEIQIAEEDACLKMDAEVVKFKRLKNISCCSHLRKTTLNNF